VTTASLGSNIFSSSFSPTFSGHETFVLRSTWLKKAYDILQETPYLFSQEDAFVQLGVGKNMAQSIRFWGRVCGVFERDVSGEGHQPTRFGRALLADDGWDPFLVTPASWWLLHWNIAARPTAAFTWFYTFNLLRGGEFSQNRLAEQIQGFVRERGWREPSETTIGRDIDCMLRCYLHPSITRDAVVAEDALLCPLSELGLVKALPGQQHAYHLVIGPQPSLPDELVAYAIHELFNESYRQRDAFQRRTISFNELAYAPRSPGRVFRLDEDALLGRLHQLADITNGAAYYTDQAGIRQVAWEGDLGPEVSQVLLSRAFFDEVRHD
jgi:hypothetical protein